MVLRKKQSHISFLHVYHHIGIAIGGYAAANFIAGGHLAFMGILNAAVHSLMYFYYFLTTFKPDLKNSIWWKKHITQLQMVNHLKIQKVPLFLLFFFSMFLQIQFTCLIFHFGRPLLLYPDCEFPAAWSWIIIIQALFMNLLFADFYYKAYIKTKKK
jgi:hypothetical protein